MVDDEEAVVNEAIEIIDDHLGIYASRNLIDANEVSDVLLDLRTLILDRELEKIAN
jgi:hypothetical protein